MQPQSVGIGVLGVPLDLVVSEKQGAYSLIVRVARTPGSNPPAAPPATSAACRSASSATASARPTTEGASGPVTPIRRSVDAAVAHTLLPFPAFCISQGQASELGRNLGRTGRLHPTSHTSIS
jgi:hypothetical protein